MLKNTLKLALRKFSRERLYSLINLAGLSIALACCLILALYLRIELTYDQHFDNYDRIYRVNSEFRPDGRADRFAISSPVLGQMMAAEFDEIEAFVTLRHLAVDYYYFEDKAFIWEDTYEASAHIFDYFSHEIIYGDPARALDHGDSVAVSQTFAEKYFGNRNPIGEVLTTDDDNPVTVMLVFKDLPENTHVKYDLLISANHPDFQQPTELTEQRQTLWWANSYNYLVMKDGFDPVGFPQMFAAFTDRHMSEKAEELDTDIELSAMALKDIHLNSDLPHDMPVGSKAYLMAFAIVAAFILAVATINYTNLATARSAGHAKSIGMRKILGADKRLLALQILAESIIFALLAMIVSLILVELSLAFTPINQLLGKTLELNLLEEPIILLWLLLFSLLVGLLSGAYPAIYLSSWAPLSALVSHSSGAQGDSFLRKGLVLIQFTISVAVIASTLLMAKQMQYLADKSLGFDKENQIIFSVIGRDQLHKTPTFKSLLVDHPNVLGAASSMFVMGNRAGVNIMVIEDQHGEMTMSSSSNIRIDYEYLDTLGIQLVNGRNFSREHRTDIDSSVLVNRSMVEKMGWTQPLGKQIKTGGGGDYGYRVIGVVENFNFHSLHSAVEPLVLFPFDEAFLDGWEPRGAAHIHSYMTVNLAGENIRETLDFVEEKFYEFDTSHNFDFKFLDDSLDELYQSEDSLMKLVGIFAGLCIFIACLGLFGLASFTTEQRSKEIGIRKTLGANASQIIFMLSKDMLSLVAVGAVVGSTLSYFSVNAWFSGFAYHTDISLTPFLIATLASLLVAYLTVAIQSFKTARADPVEALRYES